MTYKIIYFKINDVVNVQNILNNFYGSLLYLYLPFKKLGYRNNDSTQ